MGLEEAEESSGQPLVAQAEVDAAAKSLRDLCTRKSLTAQSAVDLLDGLHQRLVAAVVNGPNSNGKAPLHYAAQLRQGGDSAELCAALIQRRADVNVATRRGYTPLLFAAGRGNASAVRVLLAAEADARVTAANGDTAATCGGARFLDDDTLARLKAAQDVPGCWKDFRQSDDARAAQQDYEKKSLEHFSRAVAGRLGDRLVACSRAADCSGLPVTPTEHAMQELVMATCAGQVDKVSDHMLQSGLTDKFALRAALHLVLSSDVLQEEAGAAPPPLVLLRACCESRLSAALARRGDIKRQRGMLVRVVVGAYLVELRNSEGADALSVEDTLSAVEGDAVLALEIFRLRTDVDELPEDGCAAVAGLWPTVLDIARSRSRYASELAWVIVGRQQCVGRQRQFAACRLFVMLLRWASTMQAAGMDDSVLINDVVRLVRQERRVQDLLDILSDLDLEHELKGVLRAALQASPCLAAKSGPSAAGGSGGAGGQPPACPLFQLGSEPTWVADEDGLNGLELTLRDLQRGTAAKLRIGVDSEWCDHNAHGLSIVQLAAGRHLWVVDLHAVAGGFAAVLDRILLGGSVILLGFAFGQDAARLAALLTLGGVGGGTPTLAQRITGCVCDLQRSAAAQLEAFRGRGGPPSLRAVAEVVLGRSLDKRLQCSDWDRRPLSEEQLRYAAADAEVLLRIDEALARLSAADDDVRIGGEGEGSSAHGGWPAAAAATAAGLGLDERVAVS